MEININFVREAKKEREWLLKEYDVLKQIQSLLKEHKNRKFPEVLNKVKSHASNLFAYEEVEDLKLIKSELGKVSRVEKRVNRYENRLIKSLSKLHNLSKEINHQGELIKVINLLNLYTGIIIKYTATGGELSKLITPKKILFWTSIQKINFELLEEEVNYTITKGISPLIALLDNLLNADEHHHIKEVYYAELLNHKINLIDHEILSHYLVNHWEDYEKGKSLIDSKYYKDILFTLEREKLLSDKKWALFTQLFSHELFLKIIKEMKKALVKKETVSLFVTNILKSEELNYWLKKIQDLFQLPINDIEFVLSYALIFYPDRLMECQDLELKDSDLLLREQIIKKDFYYIRSLVDNSKAKVRIDLLNRKLAQNFVHEPNPLTPNTLIHGFPFKRLKLMLFTLKCYPSGELFGSGAKKDSTGFGFDMGLILNSKKDLYSTWSESISAEYGDTWVLFKRYPDSYGSVYKGPESKDHRVIRTAMPLTETSGFIMHLSDKVSELKEYVRHLGFYIPIYNLEGELLFTPEEYDNRS